MVETRTARASEVRVAGDTLTLELEDGRTISVPIRWFPRLQHGTNEERQNYRVIGEGEGVHWEDLDEDISVEDVLVGRPSAESRASFEKWLSSRERREGQR